MAVGVYNNKNNPTHTVAPHKPEKFPSIKAQFESLVQSAKTPSVSVVSTLLSVIALVIAAVCIAAISETLYHRTLSSFAKAALNSITSHLTYDTSRNLLDIQNTIDTIVFGTQQTTRKQTPSAEDLKQASSGAGFTLGPSIYNVSSGEFPYNAGSRINGSSSVLVNTWRDFYGNQLAALKLSRRFLFSEFDIVFSDGSYVSMDAANALRRNATVGTVGVLDSGASLFDGVLLPDPADNTKSYYYVRKTPLTTRGAMMELAITSSTIVPSSLPDRRNEAWYRELVFIAPIPPADVTTMRWSTVINYNATSGSSWVNLVALLTTVDGIIGKVRISYPLENIGWVPSNFRSWIPLNNVQSYTYSDSDEAIIGAEEFTANPELSLHRVTVRSTYALTATEVAMGCVLGNVHPGDSTRVKTCRHTITTYGNKVLQKAREVTRQNYVGIGNSYRFSGVYTPLDAAMGKMGMDTIVYEPFTCEGKKYYVSSAAVKSRESALGPTLRWVTVTIVAEAEVTGVLSDVRAIVIAVTVGIVVIIAIGFAIGTKIVLGPVSDVAFLMTAAAYLNDTNMDSSVGSFTNLTPLQAKQISARLNDRSLSRFAEVRAIQSSYYAMSDELQALKAYIPEHLRDEIMAKHQESQSQNSEENRTIVVTDVELLQLSPANEEEEEEDPHIGPPATRETNPIAKPNTDLVLSITELESVPESSDPQQPKVNNDKVPHAHQPPAPAHILERPKSARSRSSQSKGVRQHDLDPYRPIFFADSCLIDRDITVVHMNIIAFHQYARRRHPTTISSDFAEFITYINAEVKRFGGVLESFFGDKIWVSFNATSKCVNHQVAACYFAYQVTQVANGAALRYQKSMPDAPTDGSRGSKPTTEKRFAICTNGINCGVSTGKAFVGPLGNGSIKRHTIISNAITEAVALERMSLHYAGCNVFVSTSIISHIEGFHQYMFLDATHLPGSQGKRRAVASLMGAMLAPNADSSVVSRWLMAVLDDAKIEGGDTRFKHVIECSPVVVTKVGEAPNFSCVSPMLSTVDDGGKTPPPQQAIEHAVPNTNRFASVNEAFKAILRGNVGEAMRYLNDVRAGLNCADASTYESAEEFDERQSLSTSMIMLIESIKDNGIDGRTYTSSLGDVYLRSQY